MSVQPQETVKPETASRQGSSGTDHAASSRKVLIGLIALLLLLGYAFQGSRSLWSTDEGRYSGNAAQMLDSGNYLMPAFSPDRINITKPPMTTWVIAGSMDLFGRNAWAVRAPYALAFVLTGLLLFAMGGRLVPDAPWLPSLIYACSLVPFMGANVVSTDVLLTLFEALAALGFVRSHFGPRTATGRNGLWLMWLGFGLAFLTKGPPGLLPLLGMAPFVLRRDGWPGLGRLFTPTGLLLFLVAGFSWYAIVVMRTPGLLHYYLHYEVYDRLFTGAQGRHSQWYGWIVVYLPVLSLGTLPWWPAMGRGIRKAVHAACWRQWWGQATAPLFLLLWFAIPLVVFCLSRSRLPMYLLPLFLPLSLMLALDLRSRVDLTRNRQRLALAAWILVLLTLKAVAAYAVHPKVDNLKRAQELEQTTGGASYDALVFILDKTSHTAVEESTPWGMRIYTHRPVYGIAWHAQDRAARVCKELDREANSLFLIAPRIDPAQVATIMDRCPGHVTRTVVGAWRHQTLVLVRH
ncbi:glycosyltransferase family 39 protein [Oleiagrimonas sp.]|jgi:4-amino-4-deoxy-L-arabinose transferase-like glycosyltransferase|uniref:ArnT family glycosyltransferase n=1 Tax=Oleiagrimonas sp. TaxID=2010330 RepID=UPI0026073DC1|nr:glycosyltransferase family 39 protein [Oleiagrimonas sp.]MDA3913722.1 glycosyltransferase family 39 protein [Oleiagrimonas sp.]